jgi:hypothetical protein
MTCNDSMTVGCGVLDVTAQTAKIFLTVAASGCSCTNMCQCSAGFNPATTWIYIRRDGPKYAPSFGCCGNPAHRVQNCPILPGDLSFPFPTFIVPCNYPVAPPFPCGSVPISCDPDANSIQWFYKYPPFVQYNLFSRNGNELCFFLDSIFYDAPKGRYVADLFVNGVWAGCQRIRYDKGMHIQSARVQQFNRNACADNNPSPQCSTPDCQ